MSNGRDTMGAQAERPRELATALSQLGSAIAGTEALLGLDEPAAEEAEKVPNYSDVPRRLEQLVAWLAGVARRAEVINEVVAKVKNIVG